MKTLIGLTALASLVAGMASAQLAPASPNSRDSSPVAMVGISYNFGGRVIDETIGLTFKVLSSDRQDRAVVAAGVSYFPWAPKKKFGLDISTGYNFDKVTALVGYDLLNKKPQASLGYANTYKPNGATSCPPGTVLIGQISGGNPECGVI
jgi:hypothetical protein